MNLAIVVVTYNSAEEIEGCLAACPREAEICVVDNASSDGSARFATIANPDNRGFAAAVNQGFSGTGAPLVLVLNPDCRIQGGLDAMTALFQDSAVGAVGGLLLNETGLPQTGFAVRRFPTVANQVAELAGVNRLWPGNPLNRGYRCLDLDLTQEQDVDQPAGAFLLVRRTAWQQLGGFDENFRPVWFEDVDFCYRLRQAGWRIRYTPLARATHIGGHSVNKLSWECKQIYWYGSLLKYANKHWGGRGERRVALALLLVAIPRGVFGMLNRLTLEPLRVAGKIASRAIDVLRTSRQGERSGRTS